MKIEQILNAIQQLSYSQGFYGRLYQSLMEVKENDPDRFDEIAEELESQHFKDVVDMVMYFEC